MAPHKLLTGQLGGATASLSDVREKSHESAVANTFLRGESVLSLKKEYKHVTTTTGDTSNNVHGVEQGRRVLDDTVGKLIRPNRRQRGLTRFAKYQRHRSMYRKLKISAANHPVVSVLTLLQHEVGDEV
jgi:hypothetical protein